MSERDPNSPRPQSNAAMRPAHESEPAQRATTTAPHADTTRASAGIREANVAERVASARVHGGIDSEELARLGVPSARVLDLSVNVNPFGPHPRVLAAARQAPLGSYPDPHAAAARAAIARVEDIEPARVLLGHGSAELLWAAVATLAGSARPLIVVRPTFSEPESAAHAFGVRVAVLRKSETDDFALSLAALDRAIRDCAPAAIYLCQPNNPDGGALPASELRAFCAAHRDRLFILDQAFLSLSSRHADAAVRFGDNVLVVRSLTKDHALPGLRVGYALGSPELLRALGARRPAWMVSAPAQAAVVAACAQPEHVARAREFLLEAKAALAGECRALGLALVPSETHYFLARVGQADRLRQRLLERHAILVRSGTSFGLPDHIRVSGCGPEQRRRFAGALREELRR